MPDLFPHQKAGVDWILERVHRGGLIADEPGTGKTPQMAAALAQMRPRQTLIVAPKSAIGVWVEELEKWWPEAEPQVYGGQKRGRQQMIGNVVITNYAMLRDLQKYGLYWPAIVYDESHVFRNRKTETLTKTAHKQMTGQRWFMTGTPIFKNAGDLWPMLNMLDSRKYSSYWKFVREFCEVDNNGFGWQVHGVKNETELWWSLRNMALRRLKKDVFPDFPDKIRGRVPLRMTGLQARHYRNIALEMMSEIEDGHFILTPTILARDTRLRQLLVSPRLLGIDDDGAGIMAVREIAGGLNEPIVIYTPFTEAIPLIRDALGDVGYVSANLQGGMTETRIADTWQQFQKSGNPRRAIVASVAMSQGWQAWTASQCWFLGYAWDPMMHTQAEDRLHRYGQKDTVLAHYFSHYGTIDMHQMDVLSGKLTVARAILDREYYLPE